MNRHPNNARAYSQYATISALLLACMFAVNAAAQDAVPKERPRVRPPSALTGWADWEKGEALLERIEVPPAPVLTAEEELATFKVAPGYRVELVAAEPLVHNPIFFEFDPDGRIWVVEYQGYMRDLYGSGEDEPICRVVVLEDTDEDGRADKSTVFLDELIMPRSFAFVKGGVLIQEPPTLWFCEDTDGDLRADTQTEVGEMGKAGNPQHTANGLRYGIDNWLHCADWPMRYRWQDGALVQEETIKRGQFGVTFDEAGRFMTCYENRALYGDYIPAEYLMRNPHMRRVFQRGGIDRKSFGVNVDVAPEGQEVFPIRVTPAVTLGALELRDDGRLRTYTIASGTCFYDGHQYPADSRRNVFVPESGGHLLGRLKLDDGIAPKATRFYPAEQEFLASTDERFRPVNARVGPDGAMYVADMYHGIIEHVIFMVPWLTKQIEERELGLGNDLGRIWRVVAEDRPLDRSSPKLSTASNKKLVKTLDHPNGWHRLTAQRLLIERTDSKSIPRLRKTVKKASPLGQLHALWTLDGLGALDSATRLAALNSADGRVRAAAIRLSEGGPDMLTALAGRTTDTSEKVRLQLALSLGTFPGALPQQLLGDLLAKEDHPLFRCAAVSGLRGRELEFLEEWIKRDDSDTTLLSLLAQCVLEEANPERVAALFTRFENIPDDRAQQRRAILHAFSRVRYAQPFALAEEPRKLTSLLRTADVGTREQVLRALNQFTWPGATMPDRLTQNASPLKPEEKARVKMGQELYASACVACHQPHGGGVPGIAPPLAGSEWVSGPPERLARVLLHGLYGPIKVDGQTWNLSMPSFGVYDDEQIASLLSYVRRAWGNAAPPVNPALVAKVRGVASERTLPWRAEELMQVGLDTTASIALQPSESGEILLPASKATVYGQRLAYRPTLDVLAPWVVPEDMVEWQVEVPRAGTYAVGVNLAADDQSAGDVYLIETEGSQTRGEVPDTGGYDRFVEQPSGSLKLRTGVNRILLRPDGPLKRELADVRGLKLTPIR
jgi:mono/diheme cytochrome c family protein/glucose/arabinose dehydrogenase